MTYPAAQPRVWKTSTTGQLAKTINTDSTEVAVNTSATYAKDNVLVNSPATKPIILTTPIAQDTPFTLLDPTPARLALFGIQNNGSKNLYYWFAKYTSVPATNYLILTPGTARYYSTRPASIYCARTAGDTTASVSFEYWLIPEESPV
jgi:hypothetical protein